MRFVPATIGVSRAKMNMIAVYRDKVRFGKNVCRLLDIPQNRVAFEFDERTRRLYVMVSDDGFPIESNKIPFQIGNVKLSQKILQVCDARERVNLEVKEIPVAKGCYLVTIFNKL